MVDTAFFCPLSHEGILTVRGADANKFLQGQLTCNLNYLDESHSSLGARCTPKGRMISSFRVVSVDDGYLLAMALELVEPQLADLQKYAVFSKSKLTDETDQWVRFGLNNCDQALLDLGIDLAPSNDSVARSEQLIAVRVGENRAELWAPAEQAQALQERLNKQAPLADLNQWQLQQIRQGIGHVQGSTRELFIPQMLNLQALGGVSFKKGCYTGQEIVARMQYLGKLKRRLYRLALDSQQLPAPATEIFSSVHSSSVGEVVAAARSDDGIELLAVLQNDAAQSADLKLGDAEGLPLHLLDLPYTLDSDRDIQR
ncbi:CAF17-like 4Fe-4S cluster assembly/insertion protein YgfZ [Pseudomonas sp. S9]|uniref:CAF17-like 4Fe-4S cluster assembly/insertion protein YgfZ n=1 Tax=Pseudomonas sp. S9 TaxID=686578 RepID=UPI00025571AA|nr:folate-binding protein YgfZ [Pseudomonas sp. S9]